MCLLLRSLWPQFALGQVPLAALAWAMLEDDDCNPEATETSSSNATAVPTNDSHSASASADTSSVTCGDPTKLGASLVVLEVFNALLAFGLAWRMSRLRRVAEEREAAAAAAERGAVGVDGGAGGGVAQGGGGLNPGTLLSRPQWCHAVSTAIQSVAGLVLVEQPDGTLAVGKALDRGVSTNAVQIEWKNMLPDGESLAVSRQRWRRRRLPRPLLSVRITQEGTTIATVAPWHPPRASRVNPNDVNDDSGDGDGSDGGGAVGFVHWNRLRRYPSVRIRTPGQRPTQRRRARGRRRRARAMSLPTHLTRVPTPARGPEANDTEQRVGLDVEGTTAVDATATRLSDDSPHMAAPHASVADVQVVVVGDEGVDNVGVAHTSSEASTEVPVA